MIAGNRVGLARALLICSYNARTLSEVPRQIIHRGSPESAGAGALSIEPLEVSRWRGGRRAPGYGVPSPRLAAQLCFRVVP
jgi:hypothetical protein